MLSIAASSIEYVKVPVTANVVLGSQAVHMAIVSTNLEPTSGDWKTAGWDGSSVRILVGPGQTISLTARTDYVVWVKIAASPETPVLKSGTLRTY